MSAVLDCATPLALAFAVALILAWVLTRRRVRGLALDQPNERSLHRDPVPRTGGLAIMGGVFAGWLLLHPPFHLAVTLALLALASLSFIDDVRSLPVAVRLFAHLAAGGIVMTVFPGLPLLLWLAGVLGIAWMINLYNFMDGSDGLAGGMAFFGFGYYGVAAALQGDVGYACAAWAVSAAALGFLVFNFNPARIFMGDAGSVPLGFLAAAFGVQGWWRELWPLWFPLLVFSPFIVDATVTLGRRLWQRERVWEAHRDHYYQRLVQLGLGHRRTALVEYAVMILCGLAGLAGLHAGADAQSILLGSVAMAYMFAMLAIDATWRTYVRPGS
jgi:UDP-GlcNAc:undecaprenyl-phosphate GlcNAc-1-phosphate transferase